MAIRIILPFAILTRSQWFSCYSESSSQISPKSGHRWRSRRSIQFKDDSRGSTVLLPVSYL